MNAPTFLSQNFPERCCIDGAQGDPPMAITSEPRARPARRGVSVARSHLDDEKFNSLFLQHYARVYGVLFRLVGNRAEAEDLALETFWRLWERAPRRDDNLAGWLYRVATNLGYNALRDSKRRETYEARAARGDWQNAQAPDPAREAERGEERARVLGVLRQMSEREAQLLILRHSGFSYQEIAEALRLAPNSVGTLLARAEKGFERLYRSGKED